MTVAKYGRSIGYANPTNDREALELAVLLAPNDMAPRLVLADYLDDHGEPERATAIREMVRNPGATREYRRAPGGPGHASVFWERPHLWPAYTVRRGFVERVEVHNTQVFLLGAAHLAAHHPVLEVTFPDRDVVPSASGKGIAWLTD